MCGAICGVSRGKYVKPVPFPKSGIKFVDEDSGRIVHPLKYPCEHPEHWKWGRGTRNGQKLYYSLKEMFYQKWYLTKKELHESVKNYDMFSLEMQGRTICENCKQQEKK